MAALIAEEAPQTFRETNVSEESIEHHLLPRQDGEPWARIAEYAAKTRGDAQAIWVPSHPLEKPRNAEEGQKAAKRLARARTRPG